jgi:hypothetical protein
VVIILPELKPSNPLLGISSNDTPLQGASTSNVSTAGDLGHLVSGVVGLRLAKKALSGCAKKPKKAEQGQAN